MKKLDTYLVYYNNHPKGIISDYIIGWGLTIHYDYSFVSIVNHDNCVLFFCNTNFIFSIKRVSSI